jgi:hypothetical protein
MKLRTYIGRWILPVIVLWGITALVIWYHSWQHWLSHGTGSYDTPGVAHHYNFFSGSGSDLGYVTILGGLVTIIWHIYSAHNCHDPEGWLPWGCWRIGKYQAAGGQFKLCYKHHPDHMGKKPTRELIHCLHQEYKNGNNSGAVES